MNFPRTVFANVCCLMLIAACEKSTLADLGATAGAGAAGTSAGNAGSTGTSGTSAGQAGTGGTAGTATSGTGGTSGSAGSAAGTGGSNPGPDAGPGDDAGPSEPECKNGKVVHFVYFVEADESFSDAQRADVEMQAFRFQQYWYDQLGVTFYLNRPVVEVVRADHDANWYITTPDGIHDDERWYRLGNVKTEVHKKLGIQDFDPNHRVVNYPTSRHDGRVGSNFGGAWMDGDDLTCIHDNGFTYPYPDGNSAHCTGHVAHEFGHILGLAHQGPNEDCMQFGFYTMDPNKLCDFSADNVAQILAAPDNADWFKAKPGETCEGL